MRRSTTSSILVFMLVLMLAAPGIALATDSSTADCAPPGQAMKFSTGSATHPGQGHGSASSEAAAARKDERDSARALKRSEKLTGAMNAQGRIVRNLTRQEVQMQEGTRVKLSKGLCDVSQKFTLRIGS